MCIVHEGRASRYPRRRHVISGGILAGLGVLLATPGAAQVCADAISDPSLESTERLLQVADCHRDDGRLERALVLLESAAAASPSDADETIAIQGRLGRLQMARGDYPRAVEHLALALDAASTGSAPPEAAALLNDLGGAYLANDEPLLGLAAFADSARVAPRSSAIEATATLNAIRALHETGGTVDAAWLERARASVQALPESSRAPPLLTVVQLRRELALPAVLEPASLTLASEALRLAENANDAALIAVAHAELGQE